MTEIINITPESQFDKLTIVTDPFAELTPVRDANGNLLDAIQVVSSPVFNPNYYVAKDNTNLIVND